MKAPIEARYNCFEENVRLATKRNQLKRIVRETFRKTEFTTSVDVVFLAQKGIIDIPVSI